MMRAARAFTILEVMVVVAMVGVLSAAALPDLVAMTQKSQALEAMRGLGTALGVARDESRNERRCVDVTLSSSAPFSLTTSHVACPDDPPPAAPAQVLSTTVLSERLASVELRPIDGGFDGTPVQTLRFGRDGSLLAPFATIAIDVGGTHFSKTMFLYPIAGAAVTP